MLFTKDQEVSLCTWQSVMTIWRTENKWNAFSDGESDRRLNTTGVLYVDSFGSKESILVTPMIYDAIFMDMTEDGCDAIELSHMLRADGTDVPIVFCCDKVDYRKSKNLPDNALFLDKPIVVSELTETIDHLLSIKNSKVKNSNSATRPTPFT